MQFNHQCTFPDTIEHGGLERFMYHHPTGWRKTLVAMVMNAIPRSLLWNCDQLIPP
jgi:hypothetical protein